MIVLKERGTYLEENAKHNHSLAIIFLILGIITLPTLILSVLFMALTIYFFSKSNHYMKGKTGEDATENALEQLDNNYYLINDVNLNGSYGNTDHIVLGPNGIFVIESKNYDGTIICNGDEWHRHYDASLTMSMKGNMYWRPSKNYDIGSPSKQVKKCAVVLKQVLQTRFNKALWVDGVVVFTNPNVYLKLKDTTTSVLRIGELYGFIKYKRSNMRFSSNELKSIGKFILQQTL